MDLASINPRLAAVAAAQPNARQAADAISALEAQIGLPLPAEYSDFLKDYGALKIQNTDLGWFVVTFLAGDQKVVQSGYFGGFSNTERIADRYKKFIDPSKHEDGVGALIPRSMIPIGVNAGTDYVLLDLSAERSGWVWQWPEQYATWGTDENNRMGLVARGFAEFLAGIGTEDEVEAALRR